MCLPRSLQVSLLGCIEGLAVSLLLLLVVLGKEGPFFLAVGTFNVVNALADDAELLVQIALLLLELSDLDGDETLGIVIFEFLRYVSEWNGRCPRH